MRAERGPRHRCHVYHAAADRARELTLFLSDGLRDGGQCRVVAYTHSPDRAVGALAAAGIDIGAAMYDEALDVIPASSTPLLAMPFDAALAVNWIEAYTRGALAAGFSSLRMAIEMRWALASSVGEAGLAAFERGLNRLTETVPLIVLCQYDAGAFPRQLLERAMRAHPASGLPSEAGLRAE